MILCTDTVPLLLAAAAAAIVRPNLAGWCQITGGNGEDGNPIGIIEPNYTVLMGELAFVDTHLNNTPKQWTVKVADGSLVPIALSFEPPTADAAGNPVLPGAVISLVSRAIIPCNYLPLERNSH